MNVYNYDNTKLRTLLLPRVKELSQDEYPSESPDSSTFYFTDKSFDVMDECNDVCALSKEEDNAKKLLRNIYENLNENYPPEYYIPKLQDIAASLRNDKGYWRPVFYCIIMIDLAYIFFDLTRGESEDRDQNIDELSRKQTFKEMLIVLSALIKVQKDRFKEVMSNTIKKGRIAVVDEYAMGYKYYYTDMKGKKHTNYNSASSRDKDVEKYLNKLKASYNHDNSLMLVLNRIISYKDNYSVR